MGRRAAPAALVVAAAYADGSGTSRLAFYAFLALVVVAALTALAAYGELVERPPAPEHATPRHLQAILWGVLLGLSVLGAAAWATARGGTGSPRLGVTALIACLLVLCVEGLVEIVVQARPVRPVRPRLRAVEAGADEPDLRALVEPVRDEAASAG